MRRPLSFALATLLALESLTACRPSLPDAPVTPGSDVDPFGPREPVRVAGLDEDGASAFVLLPGDVVDLRVFGLETTETRGLFVDETGDVDVPLVGAVEVASMTPSEAAATIEERLHAFDRFARVQLTVPDPKGHRVTVLGAVDHPMKCQLQPDTRLADVLAEVGGPKTHDLDAQLVSLADLDAGRVIRDGVALPVSLAAAMQGDPRHNVRLHAGDLIYVPEAHASAISVLGEVRNARALPFTPGMRLSTALALAGGTNREADESDVRIVRGPLSAPRVYRASLRALVNGTAPDVLLAPGDVVYVSEHWFASATDVVQRLTPLLLGATLGITLAKGK